MITQAAMAGVGLLIMIFLVFGIVPEDKENSAFICATILICTSAILRELVNILDALWRNLNRSDRFVEWHGDPINQYIEKDKQ